MYSRGDFKKRSHVQKWLCNLLTKLNTRIGTHFVFVWDYLINMHLTWGMFMAAGWWMWD